MNKLVGIRGISIFILSAFLSLSLISIPQANALLYSCHNVSSSMPAYDLRTYTITSRGQPINGYAYLDSSSAPIGFTYTYYSSSYTLKVYLTNNNNFVVSYTFTYCFVFN